MVELKADQRQILEERPPRIFDPETRTAYVLVKADVYERLKSILTKGDEQAVQDMYSLLADLQPEDWEDPSKWITSTTA